MDAKKLIGTIIGVTAFAALIAGATFAWLTVQANITDAVYTGSSRNFVINYSGGTEIKDLRQIASGSATTTAITSESQASATTDGWLAVTASKAATTARASSFKINLSITENTLESNSLVYAVCLGSCPTNIALATVSGGSATCGNNANIKACGIINGGTTTTSGNPLTLYNDATTFNTDAVVNDTTYNVYFWLNSDTISNDDMGKSFSGYIHAEATQGE